MRAPTRGMRADRSDVGWDEGPHPLSHTMTEAAWPCKPAYTAQESRLDDEAPYPRRNNRQPPVMCAASLQRGRITSKLHKHALSDNRRSGLFLSTEISGNRTPNTEHRTPKWGSQHTQRQQHQLTRRRTAIPSSPARPAVRPRLGSRHHPHHPKTTMTVKPESPGLGVVAVSASSTLTTACCAAAAARRGVSRPRPGTAAAGTRRRRCTAVGRS